MSRLSNDNSGRWAFVVSLLSILLSFSTAVLVGLQWRDSHDQLIYTTKPLIGVDIEEDPKEPPVGIVIRNDGIGPAIIKSLVYYVDKKPVENWSAAEDSGKIDDKKIIHYELEDNYSMGASSSFWLIKYKKSGKEKPEELGHFADFLDQHIAIKIRYCSVRDDCWTICSTEGLCG